MKKSYIILLIIIVGVIVTFFLIRDDKELDMYEYKVTNNYFDNQINIDKLVQEYSDSSYTFENPKIIVNPYNNISNSVLLIFSTREETKIKIIVNDIEIGRTKKNKKHIIPVMNLKAGNNTIKIVTDDMASNKFDVKIDTDSIVSNDLNLLGAVDKNYLLVEDRYNNKYKIDYLGRIIEYFGLNNEIKYDDKILKKSIYNDIEFSDIKNLCLGYVYDEVISTSEIRDKLDSAGLSKDYNIDGLNIIFNYKGNDIKTLLVKEDKTYILPYNGSSYLGFLDDKYELYVIIDDTYYNLNLMIY